MNEAEWLTRKKRIDSKLSALKPEWKVVRYKEGLDLSSLTCHAVEEFPTDNGPADYALFVQGRLLGIIEAKKVTVNPQNVLEQAKRYASGASQGPGNWDGLRVPFLYASNGEIIWHLDARKEKRVSRRINNFHTATALEEFFSTDGAMAQNWLLEHSPDQIARLRYYQKGAIVKIEAALVDGRRQLLVAMATGTGKTYMTVAQVYRLLESKFARRILFLVDRKALAAQAVREFASFNTPRGNKFNQEYEVYSRRVEALFKIADEIEAHYQKARTHVNKLTQSILAKAFHGELVPQDPDDEPASVLLERIRREREKTKRPQSEAMPEF